MACKNDHAGAGCRTIFESKVGFADYRLAGLFALAALPGSGSAQSIETLRVVTINVWSGLDYRGYFKMGEYEDAVIRGRRKEVLIGQLRQLAPDVVALNEANKLPGYVRQVAQELVVSSFCFWLG